MTPDTAYAERDIFDVENAQEQGQKQQPQQPAPQERPWQAPAAPEQNITGAPPVHEEYAEQEDENESEDDAESSAARKGRPRSEKSRKAILKAVNALLLRMTVQELSIEAIAKKAKVGKTTIYRWWPNKTAVVMDALVNQPGMQTPLPTAASHCEAIEMQLDKLIRLLSSNNGQIIAQLFSEAQADEKALQVFEDNFLGPLMDAIQYSLECGKRDGEFKADLDIQMAIDMLCGPIFFRLMAHPKDLGTKFQYSYPPKVMEGLKA